MDLFTFFSSTSRLYANCIKFFCKKFNKLPSLQPTSNTVISLLLKYLLTEEVRSSMLFKTSLVKPDL